MKTIRLILAIYSLIFIASTSCDTFNSYFDNRLKVSNKSNNAIYADFYQSYPDTALSKLFHFANSSNKVLPNETITLGRGGAWETAFKDDINQKLIINIFDGATIENIPWDTIRKKYLILKRYELTLQDLEKLNWIVTYHNSSDSVK